MAQFCYIKDKIAYPIIRCNKNFIDAFELDWSSTSLFSTYTSPSIANCIKWIEDQIHWREKQNIPMNYKYEIEPFRFAKDKFLPKLKKYNKRLKIAIF